ncbi:MAG TPA: hypothetical protein VEY06_12090, partial [Flavisolibacter sp.]|nr:hypothetical protein [Flavisolibacter sp.]
SLSFTLDQRVGVGTYENFDRLTIGGSAGNIFIGNLLFGGGYNGVTLNGSTSAVDYNFLSCNFDKNLYINRPSGAGIHFRQSNNDQMIIAPNGNVGINATNPMAKLEIGTTNVHDGIVINHNTAGFIRIHGNSLAQGSYNSMTKAGDAGIIYGSGVQPGSNSMAAAGFVIAPWYNGSAGLRMDKEGNIGIGTNATSDANYKLFVETGIKTRKIKVDQSNWPDYVFDRTYRLRSLLEVEAYITKYSHLPEVPSAEEVEKDGIDLGEMTKQLLQKVEELTLYAIEANRKNQELEKRLRKLEE